MSEEKKEETSLSKFQTPSGEIQFHKGVEGTAEIGQNILSIVAHKTNVEFQQKVILQVQEIQKAQQKAQVQQVALGTRINFFQNQIDAINKGEFSIEAHTGRIIYNDKELNETHWLSAKFGDGL